LFSQLFRLSWHSIVYGISIAIGQILGFFLLPLYTRYLTTAGYGTLAILQTTLAVLLVIFAMGFSSSLFRSYYLYDDDRQRERVISTAFLFVTATSALLTLLLIALAGNFSTLFFHSGAYTTDFRLIFLTLFCNTGSMIGLSALRAREQPVRYMAIAVAQVVISVGLNIAFVAVLHRGIQGILEGNLITAAFIYLVLLAIVIRRAGFRFSTDELRRMLAFGLPLVPAGLSMWILTFADRYFLQFLSTPQELGLYSLGYSFGLVINVLVVSPLGLAFSPFMFSIAKEKNANEVYSRVFTYFTVVAMLTTLALSVLSKEVLTIMTTPAFHDAYKVIPLIALSYALFGGYTILTVGISLQGKTGPIAAFVLCAAALNCGLNYLLIPHHGMMGAAAATLISYAALTVSSSLLSQWYYPIKYDWGRIIKILLAAAIIYAGSLYIPFQSGVVTGVYKLLTLLAFPIILYLFRFFQPEEIQKAKEIVRAAPGYLKRRLFTRFVNSSESSNKGHTGY
jgi:O-antigen/teichoic acid export membrane protein